MVIKLLDLVEHCSTYDDGEVVFNAISPPLERGEDVVISFNGVSAVPSAFVNAAIVRLVERMPIGQVKAHLKIIDSTKQINELIKSRFEFLSGVGPTASPVM